MNLVWNTFESLGALTGLIINFGAMEAEAVKAAAVEAVLLNFREVGALVEIGDSLKLETKVK